MRENGLAFGDIGSIHCGISPRASKMLSQQVPDCGLGGKFHLAYCLAIAARYGNVTGSHFEDVYLRKGEIQKLMNCVQTDEIAELARDPVGFGTRLTVTTRGKDSYTVSGDKPRWSDHGQISWAEVSQKFRSCVEGILDQKAAAFIENSIRQMEQLESLREVLDAACYLQVRDPEKIKYTI